MKRASLTRANANCRQKERLIIVRKLVLLCLKSYSKLKQTT